MRRTYIGDMRLIHSITGAVISLLIAGNVFFVKKTFDRLDSLEQITWQLRQEVAVLRATLEKR